MMQRRTFQIALAVSALMGATQVLAAPAVQVVTSFSILADVAREIGGDRVRVTALVGNDQDAHVYKLRPSDLRTIRSANVVLLNGLGFEGADMVRAVRSSKVLSADAAEGIKTLQGGDDHHGHGNHHDHDHGKYDPHVWTNPKNMLRYAQNVSTALTKADPAGSAYYAQRLKSYQTTLTELDKWAEQQFNTIPKARRKVLTGHDAFAYMGQRYGVQFLAPQGISTESEASAKTVAAIVRQVRQEKIKAVFMENIKDARLVQQLAKEAGVTVQTTPLYSDALSSQASSYTALVRHNVNAMVKAMK